MSRRRLLLLVVSDVCRDWTGVSLDFQRIPDVAFGIQVGREGGRDSLHELPASAEIEIRYRSQSSQER
jgi:hypothetical protein